MAAADDYVKNRVDARFKKGGKRAPLFTSKKKGSKKDDNEDEKKKDDFTARFTKGKK